MTDVQARRAPGTSVGTVSVVIPTVRRVALLSRCLGGLERQDRAADEIVVVHRADDDETRALVAAWRREDPARRRVAVVDRPGIIPALDAGTRVATGAIVAYLDDDSVPDEGWLRRIVAAFTDRSIGGVGGRFVNRIDGREVGHPTRRVGTITWYGRVIGRHDGITSYRGDVEFLPGTNWALRKELAFHSPDLLHASTGLALANELDSCLTVRRLGYRLIFDPDAVVVHDTTSFRDPVLGSRVAGDDVYTSAANYTFALLKYLPLPRRLAFRLYAYLVGSYTLPGPLRALGEALRHPSRVPALLRRIPVTWRGRLQGERMYRRWRARAGSDRR